MKPRNLYTYLFIGVAISAPFVVEMVTPAGAASACTASNYGWQGFSKIHGSDSEHMVFHPGVGIPAPGAGETLTVQGVSFETYDGYSADGGISRSDQNQGNEQFGLRIGGTDVSSLSPDLPDSLDEGAASITYSGVLSGTLGGWNGTQINGGVLEFRHSSTYGATDGSPNSMTVSAINVAVELCSNSGAAPTPGQVQSQSAPPAAPAPALVFSQPVAAPPAPAPAAVAPPAPAPAAAPAPAPTPKAPTAAPAAAPKAPSGTAAPAVAAANVAAKSAADTPRIESVVVAPTVPFVAAAAAVAGIAPVEPPPALVATSTGAAAVAAAVGDVPAVEAATTTIAASIAPATAAPVTTSAARAVPAIVPTRTIVMAPGTTSSRSAVVGALCLLALIVVLLGAIFVLISGLSKRTETLRRMLAERSRPDLA